MLQQIERKQAHSALRRALLRRRGSPLGTPLQKIYAQNYDAATPAKAITFWGAEMQVVLPELVSCEIYEHGVIEPALTALFIELVGTNTIVYDVGAHLGYYSSLAAALGGKVHAFEPSRETLPILRANVGDEVTVAPTALWEEETTLTFKDFGGAHSSINTFLSPKDETAAEPEAVYPVEVTTLDRYVAETGEPPGLIKIDAEGAEAQVLRGATTILREARPYLTVEVGDTAKEQTSRSALEVALEFDYGPYDLTEEGVRPHTMRHTYAYGNVLLIPRGTEAPPLLEISPAG